MVLLDKELTRRVHDRVNGVTLTIILGNHMEEGRIRVSLERRGEMSLGGPAHLMVMENCLRIAK